MTETADTYDGPKPVTIPFRGGMPVTVSVPGWEVALTSEGVEVRADEGVHVVTFVYDTSGYGRDDWACSCGVRNGSRLSVPYRHDTHIPDGAVQVRIDTYNESED